MWMTDYAEREIVQRESTANYPTVGVGNGIGKGVGKVWGRVWVG